MCVAARGFGSLLSTVDSLCPELLWHARVPVFSAALPGCVADRVPLMYGAASGQFLAAVAVLEI